MRAQKQNLYGEVIEKKSIAGINFTETSYNDNCSLPLHFHDFDSFCFVLRGNFTEKVGNSEDLLTSSSIIFRPAGDKHSDFFYTASSCFNLQISDKLLSYIDRDSLFSQRLYSANDCKLSRIVNGIYREFYDTDEFSSLTVEGLMLELTGEFLRNNAKTRSEAIPDWLERARDFIVEEFTSDLSISEIAKTVDIHPTHLAKEFRRFFQVTIGDFIRQKRIEYARHRIIDSDAPLSEISAESGFYDQSHFTKLFKKATEMTPAQFRTVYKR